MSAMRQAKQKDMSLKKKKEKMTFLNVHIVPTLVNVGLAAVLGDRRVL